MTIFEFKSTYDIPYGWQLILIQNARNKFDAECKKILASGYKKPKKIKLR